MTLADKTDEVRNSFRRSVNVAIKILSEVCLEVTSVITNT